ncbi:ABC transporter permease [Actinopolymorpha alba]|uniref:ABC transporter permease n=1 Tax=Actinopolymorpha alba TaxID=533267 RepID=UPI000374DC1E|nr:iron ABC transporter permease [Actinopolymorpha alba]
MTASTDAERRTPGRFQWRRWFLEQGLLLRAGVLLLSAVLLVLLVFPVLRMTVSALFPDGSLDLHAFGATVRQPWFWPMLRDTVIAVACSSVLSLIVASSLAWINERTDAGLGWLGTFMPLMPLLMPPIAVAAGWMFLASPKVGFLNGLLAALPGGFELNILSMPGLIFVYTLELVPFAYIPIAGALRNLDPALEEASRVSGAGVLKTIVRVSLPAVSQAMVSAFFLLVVVGFALYSAPVVIGTGAGIDILSVRIVRLMHFEFPSDLASATVLTTILLVFVLSAWLLQNAVTRRGQHAMISGRSGNAKMRLGRWRIVLRVITISYLLMTTVLPLLAVILVALQPYWTPTIDFSHLGLQHFERMLFKHRVASKALETSVLLGLLGGLVAVAVTTIIAIARRRTSFGVIISPRIGSILDAVTKLPAAFSAIVIALGFVVTFSGPPFHLNGTYVILLLAYLVIFMPQVSTTTSNALSQVGGDLTEASYISGGREWRTFTRITLPLARPGLLNAWALIFVLIVGELAASTLLAGTKTPVIGFVLVEIWENGTVGPMAAFATIVTAITSTAVILFILLGRQRYRRGA